MQFRKDLCTILCNNNTMIVIIIDSVILFNTWPFKARVTKAHRISLLLMKPYFQWPFLTSVFAFGQCWSIFQSYLHVFYMFSDFFLFLFHVQGSLEETDQSDLLLGPCLGERSKLLTDRDPILGGREGICETAGRILTHTHTHRHTDRQSKGYYIHLPET